MKLKTAILILLLCLPVFALSHSHNKSSAKASTGRKSRATARRHSANYCASCARDSKGRIKRSRTARADFKRTHPCPATGLTSRGCKGYVIDHRQALKRAGVDDPSNMQWQTKAEARAKDRVED